MTQVVSRPAAVDPARWPDVAVVPRARLRGRVAAALLGRVGRRLDLLDGPGPTLELRDPEAFCRRLGRDGLIGFGESYQAGEWDSARLPEVLTVLAAHADVLVPRRLQWLRRFYVARHPRTDANDRAGARSNIARHYDLSNELFGLFLDDTMTYSAALFDGPATWENLTTAQHRKIDRLLDATGVGPGTRVLEIGTGWGELAIRAARRGAVVRSVTLSAEQRDLALRRAADAGVDIRVDLLDYRDVRGEYDAILSVEMIEAVGEEYWPTYTAALDALLAPGGRVGLQAITMRHERMVASRYTYTWIHKYIFPGGLIPSLPALSAAFGRTRLRILDTFAFGPHYADTLRLWRARFLDRAGDLARLGFDDTFRRTWNLYLAYSEAGFASGYLDVHQLVLGKAET
ncbi:cyclopropane-fatty-acyl-phospholipid synthase family protein [Longispora sp. K20-0274]|uniref:class I SAM-dependent methyltransferase n=1 Tax=Longispora sp. K20-0274 TaxID=3088255 RepID=UPI00399BFCC4